MVIDRELLTDCQRTNDKAILKYIKKGMKDEKFYLAFKRACLDKKVSYRDVAKILGYSYGTITAYALNLHSPSLFVLVILEQYFDVPAGYFQALVLRDKIKNLLKEKKRK